MIAEAGGNLAGLQAVAAVIQNRANKTGLAPAQVVRQQGQFQGYSNPGSASVKAQSDPQVRALAEKAYNDIASGTVPDPTNGGTSFRAATAAKGMSAPHGTVDIGGNRFAKGNSSPQTALSAINAVAPVPQPRPTSALGYEPQPAVPSVRAITVNPNGSPQTPQMQLPQAAMYGINRLDPNHVTHAPTDFTTQDVGVPDARLSQLSAPFPQPANAFAGSRATGGTVPLPTELTTRKVPIYSVDSLGNPILTQPAKASGGSAPTLASGSSRAVPTVAINAHNPTAASVIRSAAPIAAANTPKVTFVPSTAQNNIASENYPTSLNLPLKSSAQTGSDFGSLIGSLAAPKPPVPIVQTSRPTAAQMAAINDVSGVAPTTHTAVANQSRIGSTPSPVLSFNGDQNTGIPGVAAMPPSNALPVLKAPIPHPYPITQLPTVPVSRLLPSSGLIPLTHFNTVNPASQIIPHIQSFGNSTPIGHIGQLIAGEPIQGGLLGALFNSGGLLNSGPRMVAAPTVPQPLSALVAQQSPDQRGQAALQASGMLDSFGMITGSGGHSMWGSH